MPNIEAIANEQVKNCCAFTRRTKISPWDYRTVWDYHFPLGLRHTIEKQSKKGIWRVAQSEKEKYLPDWTGHHFAYIYISSILLFSTHRVIEEHIINNTLHIVEDITQEFDSPTVFLSFVFIVLSIGRSFSRSFVFSADDIIEKNLLDNGGAVATTTCDRTVALTHSHSLTHSLTYIYKQLSKYAESEEVEKNKIVRCANIDAYREIYWQSLSFRISLPNDGDSISF